MFFYFIHLLIYSFFHCVHGGIIYMRNILVHVYTHRSSLHLIIYILVILTPKVPLQTAPGNWKIRKSAIRSMLLRKKKGKWYFCLLKISIHCGRHCKSLETISLFKDMRREVSCSEKRHNVFWGRRHLTLVFVPKIMRKEIRMLKVRRLKAAVEGNERKRMERQIYRTYTRNTHLHITQDLKRFDVIEFHLIHYPTTHAVLNLMSFLSTLFPVPSVQLLRHLDAKKKKKKCWSH